MNNIARIVRTKKGQSIDGSTNWNDSLSIEGMKLGIFDDFLMPLDLDSLISRIREAYQAKKVAEVVKPSLFQRCQNIIVAASFAEAGEAETTKSILGKEHNCKELKNMAKERKYKKQ